MNPQTPTPISTTTQVQPPAQPEPPKPKKALKTSTILLVAGLVLLLVGLAVVGTMAMNAKTQSDQASVAVVRVASELAKIKAVENAAQIEIDESRYQAVFLTSGQVYFGKITKLTSDTIILEDIYYLQNGGKYEQGSGDVAASSSTSLVKLGNELHKPDDKMVIERKNVQFFENLKSDGQVVKAIRTYQKQN